MPFSVVLVLTFLLVSWIFIYALEKKNIFRLWLTPPSQRFKEFTSGFLFMGVLSVVSQLSLSTAGDVNWMISDSITLTRFLRFTALDLNSVLFEELLFRGVLLYVLLKYQPGKTGILISSAAFGVYHWFTFGVFGNPLAMLLVFITTALMGYVFAKAYAKTASLILPVGLHFGWNWINNSVFSNGPSGNVLLIPSHQVEMEGYHAAISFALYLIIPALTLVYLHYFNSDKLKTSKHA